MYLFFKKENLLMRVLILLLSIASLSVFIFGNDESKVKNSSVDCINNNAITFDEYGNELNLVQTIEVQLSDLEEELKDERVIFREYYSELVEKRTFNDYNNKLGETESSKGTLTLSISEEVSYEYSFSLGINAEIFETAVGVVYGKSRTVTSTNSVDTNNKKTVIKAYPKMTEYTYDIYDEDIFFDDYVGEVSYTKSTSVVFKVYK